MLHRQKWVVVSRPESLARSEVFSSMSAIADLNRAKTHCKYGHPLIDGNVFVYTKPNGTTARGCIECRRRRSREHYQRVGKAQRLARDPAAVAAQGRKQRAKEKREFPENRRAYQLVHAALRRGELVKAASCERCGKSDVPLEGSHDDYSRPLDVEWLCRQCHAKKDRKHKLPENDPPPDLNSSVPAGIGSKI